MAISIAMGCIMRELTDFHEEVGVSLIASIELIVQAQQAVIATTRAYMAASSVNPEIIKSYRIIALTIHK